MSIETAPVTESAGTKRETVHFLSHGETLEAYLYLPASLAPDGGFPATVTAPGLGGVKEMLIGSYAGPIAQAGFACLSVDYRHFGGSTGNPRQHIDPRKQVEDIKAGLDYLEQRDDINSDRLGIWGTSMSGGHSVTIAATDDRIKAAVALIPFLVSSKPSGDVGAMRRAVMLDGLKRLFGGKHGTIPIFAETVGQFAVMGSDGGWDWMQGITKQAPNYRNEITLQSLLKIGSYEPGKKVSDLAVPTLLVAAAADTITPADPIREFAKKAGAFAEYVEFPQSHFELFGESLSASASQTVEWFKRHL